MSLDFSLVCRDVITRHAQLIAKDGIKDLYEQVNDLALDMIGSQTPRNCKKAIEIFQYRLQEMKEANLDSPIPPRVINYILDVLDHGPEGVIRAKIGEGHYCAVYQYCHSDKFYALKGPKGNAYYQDIADEFQILSRVVHENIVLAFDNPIFTTPKCGHELGIVLELAECSLEQVLKGAELERQPLYQYMQDIMRGTNFLHLSGYIHGDLGPNNVGIFKDGKAKLIDFGYSQKINSIGPVGTEKYRAFEVSRDSFMRPEAEVFSVGVLIYNILTADNGHYRFPEFHENRLIKEKIEMISPNHPDLKKHIAKIQHVIVSLLRSELEERISLTEALETMECL